MITVYLPVSDEVKGLALLPGDFSEGERAFISELKFLTTFTGLQKAKLFRVVKNGVGQPTLVN